ncbi:MAG TPA: hypothetical protein VGL91_17175 [Acidobacteriota bacterium]|jgi:hypothetical protein
MQITNFLKIWLLMAGAYLGGRTCIKYFAGGSARFDVETLVLVAVVPLFQSVVFFLWMYFKSRRGSASR